MCHSKLLFFGRQISLLCYNVFGFRGGRVLFYVTQSKWNADSVLVGVLHTFTLKLKFKFSRRFYPTELQSVHLSEERETTTHCCRYSKDVHRTKCQALTNVMTYDIPQQ